MNILKPSKQLPIVSTDITLEKVVANENLYNIPIYQRLYVWGNDQINTLLEDLFKAFEEDQPKYYLGGIMVTQNDEKLDLIDGQQRFTTLWLISKILGHDLVHFQNYTLNKLQKSRISFSVRDFANRYFDSNNSELILTKEEWEELQPISSGEELIKTFVNKLTVENRKDFAAFIYKKVFLVATHMPEETDENKVFEAMNNRGVQLQQHEILKSTLLSALKGNKTEMHRYSLLWDACSIMDEYLEKNIKIVANLNWKNLFAKVTDESEKIVQLPIDIHSRLTKEYLEVKQRNLLSILSEDINDTDLQQLGNTEAILNDYESGKVRSIINFPMLLLHTLRIFQHRYKDIINTEDSAEVKGKDLIEIFKKHNHYFAEPTDVKIFIDLLWEIRKNFDRHIIKWVSVEENNEEVHLIKKLYQNETAFQRKAPTANEGFALLQSMLYHSQQIITHYWLTPLLNKMLDVEDTDELYAYLEKLDNAMFCSKKRDLRTMSYEMMFYNDEDLVGDFTFAKTVLNSSYGTGYPSYWFYKTEYILWKNRKDLKCEHWQEYRMTAKNSVEHISPQNPKPEEINIVFSHDDDQTTIQTKKDDFGNLVLLSPGMNSEYSNKTYNVKRAEFRDKKRLDSLKSDLIFQNDSWNWGLCEIHRVKIINLFENHIQ
ncbi:DUF262 domain-containing protein [Flavobacterium sp. F-328]|uniref:DUF262 domain-containing protein n=1 Tax=Flavobacterium erciyesense TaxID=2825842 RepID=A0ABS5D6U5_9FLAO|nr:DUF262 domain-containing protein [Flavobacterium erciyesense]MBQ0909754.1 DUF262 domain-containing protein [Flavobacterium erciyesense]